MRARGTTARGDHWIEIVRDDGSDFAFCDESGTPHEDSGGPIHVMGSDQVYDVLEVVVKQRNELRAALKEALDGWEACADEIPGSESWDWDRLAELRKLVGE